jgi:hypothetical protein
MKLPDYFMVSETDGHLYDTRKPDWANNPVRRDYRRTFRNIKTGAHLRATLRAGGFTFPGCYTIALRTNDGEMASPVALSRDKRALWSALWDIRQRISGRIVGADTYLEGPTVQCCYTNDDIESAYGDPSENEGETE